MTPWNRSDAARRADHPSRPDSNGLGPVSAVLPITPAHHLNRPGPPRKRLATALLLTTLAAAPARADCRREGSDVVCPEADFAELRLGLRTAERDRDTARASAERLSRELAAALRRAEACETRPPPPEPSRVPAFLAGAGTAIVVLAALAVARQW